MEGRVRVHVRQKMDRWARDVLQRGVVQSVVQSVFQSVLQRGVVQSVVQSVVHSVL